MAQHKMAGRLISVVAELDLFVSKYFMHARWLVRAQVRNKKPIMFIRLLSVNTELWVLLCSSDQENWTHNFTHEVTVKSNIDMSYLYIISGT